MSNSLRLVFKSPANYRRNRIIDRTLALKSALTQSSFPTTTDTTPAVLTSLRLMSVIDVIDFSLSLLGIYGPILLILYLLPRNLAPRLFTLLDETQQLLRRAEELGAVPPQSEYKHRLDR